MTDIASLTTHADPQLSSVAALPPLTHRFPNGIASLDGTADEEESSIIKCICGFNDDDGSTVLCEKCNTWQHISCYYESEKVPDVHECRDCNHRPLDERGASERQRLLRAHQHAVERKAKRPPTKSHKKKVKDSTGTVQVNGWSPSDRYESHDRASASPRDQPPPAKRPKTSHRTSTSIASLNQSPALAANPRLRGGDAILNRQSPAKSPPAPALTNGTAEDYFSLEFMQLCRQGEVPVPEGNLHTTIGLTNTLTAWLTDSAALSEATGGKQKHDVFSAADRPIEQLEAMAPAIARRTDEDLSITAHGMHPVIHYLVTCSDVLPSSFIGELRGSIGFKEEYIQDPVNRWSTLRHPEPFVFFLPHLPIYIDTRREGTLLRYLRRSCDPNLQIKTIIGDNGSYHFCLISTREIAEGDELTVGWNIDGDVNNIIANLSKNGNLKRDGFRGQDEEYISRWVAGVLANYGGCACSRPDGVCVMSRFDRRNGHHQHEAVSSLKPPKSRRKKATHVSPLSTGRATNSRASSETNKYEHDDENADSRSASGSIRSKPGSRDITPLADGTELSTGNGAEVSERDRRKIQQLERLFEKQQEEIGGRKKKRNSAGSTLNTPGVSTSVRQASTSLRTVHHADDVQKQLGFPDNNHGSAIPGPGPGPNGIRSQHVNGAYTSAASPKQRATSGSSSRSSTVVKPTYTSSSTQTEPSSSPLILYTPPVAGIRKRQCSFAQRLLRRAQTDYLKRQQRTSCQADNENQQSLQSPLASSPLVMSAELGPAVVEDVVVADQSAIDPTPNIASDYESRAVGTTSPEPVEPLVAPTATMMPPPRPTADAQSSEPTQDGSQAQEEEMEEILNASHNHNDDHAIATEDEPESELLQQTSHPPIHPHLPPRPSADLGTETATLPSTERSGLHVQMPPVPNFTTQRSTTPSLVDTPGPLTGSSFAQSPAANAAPQTSFFPPSVAAAVAPSPMKKKMSLSDYTRKKAKATGTPGTSSTSAPNDTSLLQYGTNEVSESSADISVPTLQSSTSSVLEEVDMPLAPLSHASSDTPVPKTEPTAMS
ncbi:hypothetical protein LTS18_007833 [Coniosporium uncinatum]|uniref:Uncharacterized protein n=1 Tax=Coniosporium uncinatum TaxID=93489 RepID=A0ACC3E010_9PEZI|nr:hypothetical protein LTS18_007833 [Coniosporium uncinatum]